MVDAVEGIERIRYTSPHPKDMREDVIARPRRAARVCEHIHLPLQAGSSRILKAMRRTYNRERYLDRVAMIREHVPDCALTTDIIVGFPGETEADFEETMEVVEAVRYDSAFTFIFSPAARHARRPSCRPAAARGQARAHGAPGGAGAAARHRARAALRGPHDGGAGGGAVAHRPVRLRGRTRHNKTVNFAGVGAPGELVEVEIASATSTTLAGEELLLARRASAAAERPAEVRQRRAGGQHAVALPPEGVVHAHRAQARQPDPPPAPRRGPPVGGHRVSTRPPASASSRSVPTRVKGFSAGSRETPASSRIRPANE